MLAAMWIPATGKIEVDKSKGRVAVALHNDFVLYYKWFVERYYGLTIDPPLFGAHVTLGLAELHRKLDFSIANQYKGRKVSFEYSIDIVVGGSRKKHTNFWLRVRSEELETIRNHIKAFDSKNFQGLHITVGNNKNVLVAEEERIKQNNKKRDPSKRDKYSRLAFWRPIIEIRG